LGGGGGGGVCVSSWNFLGSFVCAVWPRKDRQTDRRAGRPTYDPSTVQSSIFGVDGVALRAAGFVVSGSVVG